MYINIYIYIYYIYVCIYIYIWYYGIHFELRGDPEWDSNARPRVYCAHALTTELSARTMRYA